MGLRGVTSDLCVCGIEGSYFRLSVWEMGRVISGLRVRRANYFLLVCEGDRGVWSMEELLPVLMCVGRGRYIRFGCVWDEGGCYLQLDVCGMRELLPVLVVRGVRELLPVWICVA